MPYQGSCHCQAVRIECEFTLKQPVQCNCSYCYKRHAPLHIVDSLRVIQGEDALSIYRFNSGRGEHHFCRHCGIFVYSTPPEPVYPYAINLAILDNCDWEALPLHHFDGKSL